MKAEILSIGTELLLGSIVDTNAAYLAQRLAAIGIDCYYISQVGDNLERLTATLARAWERSDLVITTGGLGPTQDDLTREAIAALLNEEMQPVPALEAELRANFARRGAEMPAANIKQATLIPSAKAITNPVGTAPGWWVKRETPNGTRQIVSMPGVPFEMKRMWEREVEPRFQAESGFVIMSRTLKVLGYGESAVEARVSDLMGGSNPTLAPYAKQDGIHLRITAKVRSKAEGEPLVLGLEAQVRERLGEAIYGIDEQSPWEVTADLLGSSGLTIALLEVGPSSAGVLAPLVSALGEENRAANRGYLTVASLDEQNGPLGSTQGSFEEALARWKAQTAADLALGVRTEVRRTEELESTVVQLNSSIRLFAPGAEKEEAEARRADNAWRTASSEVKRLVGLAACNMLRLQLLQLESRAAR
jgi:nicotinamide-nucleotide amidase